MLGAVLGVPVALIVTVMVRRRGIGPDARRFAQNLSITGLVLALVTASFPLAYAVGFVLGAPGLRGYLQGAINAAMAIAMVGLIGWYLGAVAARRHLERIGAVEPAPSSALAGRVAAARRRRTCRPDGQVSPGGTLGR